MPLPRATRHTSEGLRLGSKPLTQRRPLRRGRAFPLRSGSAMTHRYCDDATRASVCAHPPVCSIMANPRLTGPSFPLPRPNRKRTQNCQRKPGASATGYRRWRRPTRRIRARSPYCSARLRSAQANSRARAAPRCLPGCFTRSLRAGKKASRSQCSSRNARGRSGGRRTLRRTPATSWRCGYQEGVMGSSVAVTLPQKSRSNTAAAAAAAAAPLWAASSHPLPRHEAYTPLPARRLCAWLRSRQAGQ